MSDWPPKPQNEPTNSNNVSGKEWQILEKAVLASVEEQRRSRRWSIFFKCLGFAYLLIVLMAMTKSCSTDSSEKATASMGSDHLAVVNIVGTIDSFAEVSGNGIKKLIESGKKVIVGVLENECIELNKRFFTFHEQQRPYIILKWAESQDGFIAPISKEKQEPVWITNKISRQLVHKWRSEEQAILAGTQTVVDDNPKLNTRDWSGNNPVRVVLDQNNRISKESFIFDNKKDIKC